jgi:hypothetical protein
MIPYTIKSFRGGVSDETDKGVSGSFKHGHGLDIHKRADTLSCKQAMVTVEESTVNDLINFFVPASDGSTYAFGSAGSIYVRSGDGVWNFAYNDENGAIKGAAEWEFSDGNNYLFWATNTSVARRLLNGSADLPWPAGAATQDYKTTLTSADWHTMKPASGELMIANAESVATLDYDGSFNPANLNIRPGNLVKTIEERDDYAVFGSGRNDGSEEGHLYSWDGISTNWSQKKRVPVKGVNAMILAELILLQGGEDGEIFTVDSISTVFGNPILLNEVNGGGSVRPGGVSIENDIALFGFSGGDYPGLWSYGRRGKNRPQAMNYEYRLAKTVAGSTVTSIGAVAVVNGEVLASWKTTDGSTVDYGVDCVSSTTKASALYEGLEFDGGSPHLTKNFDTIELAMAPLPSGCSVSAKFKMDRESAWRYAFLGDGGTTFSESGATKALFSLGTVGAVYEVGIELNPSVNETPEVTAITTYISEGGQDHG